MDNQFLSTPLLTNKQKKKEDLANSLTKGQLILGLEKKNRRLKAEIQKIQAAINETLQADEAKGEKNQKRTSIMRTEQNYGVMTKELANVYKKIKMYEYQIGKLEESQSNGAVIARTKQIQTIIKEKRIMTEKLKSKIHNQERAISDNTKKLSNNNMQQEIERKLKSLTDEIKFLREKEKQQDAKDEIKQSNMKRQFQFIKKLQNQLVENGMSGGQLDEIKQRAIKNIKSQPIVESHVTKQPITHRKEKQDFLFSQVIEDRTKDHYKVLKNEIKVLDKIQSDHEKKIVELQNEKGEAIEKNQQSRDRLLEIEDEIQNLQREILILKGKVVPSNLKPLRPLRSVSSQQVHEKKKIMAKNQSMNKGGKSLVHPIKFDEVGMSSEKGQRFTDRNILGKSNLNTKITGMTVFIDKENGVICGIQCIYSNKKRGGQYVKKDRDAREKQYHEQSFVCDEKQWIKSVSGTLTPQDKLQSIYVISSTNKSHRFGQAKTTRKAFVFDIASDEVPVCIFGSLLNFKQPGKKQHSIIEHFGVEINSQRAMKKEDN